MSQTCSLLELVLVDVRDLQCARIRDLLKRVTSHGVLRGAVAAEEAVPDARTLLSDNAEMLDFWFVGSRDEWPFDRALAFAGVTPGRAAFVSSDGMARKRAEVTGLLAGGPETDVIERLLP